jgi:hypothetical protein
MTRCGLISPIRKRFRARKPRIPWVNSAAALESHSLHP